jgi:hypothetical protein
VEVRLKLPGSTKPAKVRLATPQNQADQDLPFSSQAGAVRFQIPRVNVYAIAVIE